MIIPGFAHLLAVSEEFQCKLFKQPVLYLDLGFRGVRPVVVPVGCLKLIQEETSGCSKAWMGMGTWS